MGKKSLLGLILLMTLVLLACGGEKLVEIEIPKMIVSQSFGELTQEDAQKMVNEEQGIKKLELKDDGTLVLRMTKEEYESLLVSITG